MLFGPIFIMSNPKDMTCVALSESDKHSFLCRPYCNGLEGKCHCNCNPENCTQMGEEGVKDYIKGKMKGLETEIANRKSTIIYYNRLSEKAKS